MSSQNQGIPLHHQPHDAGYRLIELPMEVQSTLESNPAPVLTLEESDTTAILRTPNNSYHLRQKNTSNALLLLAPQTSFSTPEQGLSTISTIHETVELEVIPDHPINRVPLKDTGSKGKWHERFGKGR
ncbi:hypothetical protein TOPH_05414 [Tolypocladium ophioglossoides CBS 100239]|uniref:Sister chromatid cohesion protein DCC1 n=1 Tax=Tolypocladium ophioglossoides (strain CBS 100239) TaxID=1163406 RepID=A0A0L0N7G1_TOLOC|nr:hypothetical protein TOPH_05414 [Tolypocladium ophioglossoides CBS 100239]